MKILYYKWVFILQCKNDCFVGLEDMIEEDFGSVYEDDYDYERDTFYALGGEDYDEWKIMVAILMI